MIFTVIYPNHEGARFDAAYYRDSHGPAATALFDPVSVTLVEGVSTPDGGPAPYAMIAQFAFASTEAMNAALADPGVPALIADVANFTDIEPQMMIGRLL